MKLLAINSGSSTLKFRLYNMPEEKILIKGSFEAIGTKDSCYSIKINDKKEQEKIEIKTHMEAVNILIEKLLSSGLISNLDEIEAVGHRVVHGGNKYSKSVIVNDRVLQEIEAIKNFAPLHNPAALTGIKEFTSAIPKALEVVCFDTAFHQSIEEKNYLYPIPYELYIKYDIRKYGFHGLSHKFITLRMQDILKKDNLNLIVCHIGNGASITAIKNSKCVDTSMGFTPNSGLMMGTRSGSIDYSIIGYLLNSTNMNYDEIDNMLNKNSGLLGITGMNDLRDIDRAYIARDRKVILAIDMYTRRIANFIAEYFLLLDGKIDAICFTAGGGENDDIIRKEVLDKIKALGIIINQEKNQNTIVRKGIEGIITDEKSSIPVYVLATDEELMIAKDTYKLFENKKRINIIKN